MIFRFLLVFLFLFSCSNKNKVFLCGDHECIDKKEMKEYFAKNLAIEVKTREINKKRIDLVKLNTKTIKKKYDLIVDVQGDEPLLDPKHIDKVIEFHKKNINVDIILPYLKIHNADNNNIVKILTNIYSATKLVLCK